VLEPEPATYCQTRIQAALAAKETDMSKYVARFVRTPGRYLIDGDDYSGQRIIGGPDSVAGRKQWDSYHNPPDRETGFWLNESLRQFSPSETLSIMMAPKMPAGSYAAKALAEYDHIMEARRYPYGRDLFANEEPTS
jgi:hypothetical protein